MSIVSFTPIADGTTADGADVNTPFTTLYNDYNGNIDNSNIKSGAAIDASKLADASITNAKLSTTTGEPGGAWQSWTPTWTNVTIGNSTVTCKYIQIGKTVFCRMIVVLGTTFSASGIVTFSLPVTSVSYSGTAGLILIGNGAAYDVTPGSVYLIAPVWNSTTTAKFNVFNASGTYTTLANMTGTVPITWDDPDEWHCEFFYEAA